MQPVKANTSLILQDSGSLPSFDGVGSLKFFNLPSVCNRSNPEKCAGEFERITRQCGLEDTKGVGLWCHSKLGWLVVVIGAGEITQFPSGKSAVLCSRWW